MNDRLTTTEIAKRLHVSTAYVRRQIAIGRLASHGGGHRHSISRPDVIRWLLAAKWESEKIRGLFPLPGPLALVSVRCDLMHGFRQEKPVSVRGLFDMGRFLNEYLPWGIVVDLFGTGGGRSRDDLAVFSSHTDRPVLIALVGDDGVEPGVFDFTIPDSLPIGKIAQRIRALRPWGK